MGLQVGPVFAMRPRAFQEGGPRLFAFVAGAGRRISWDYFFALGLR